jgi:uncharacterized membrane protein
VPAAFFAARRFFAAAQALGAAALVAITPWLIGYSVNGRGYMLVTLLALLLANVGGLLVQQPSRGALIAYGLIGALGFYTIPIFLYPMAGVSLWVLVAYLIEDVPLNQRARKASDFLLT